MEDDAFVEFVNARVQRGGAADVEVEDFRTRLISDCEKVTKSSRDKESDLSAIAFKQRVGCDGGAHSDGGDG